MNPARILLFVPRSSVLEANCEVFFLFIILMTFTLKYQGFFVTLEATSSTAQPS